MRTEVELRRRLRTLEQSRGGSQGSSPGPRPLWQVTAVDSSAGTCTVQGVRWDGSSLVADDTREKQDVLYDPNNPPSEGARGHLKGLSGGQRLFVPPGEGGGTPQMIQASQGMTADDTFYDAAELDSDGTTGSTIQVKRPNGVTIDSGQVGYMGQDTGGEQMFIPANMRETVNNAFGVEARTSDPSSPFVGQEWLRTDLY